MSANRNPFVTKQKNHSEPNEYYAIFFVQTFTSKIHGPEISSPEKKKEEEASRVRKKQTNRL